jgi:hypothetical protein
MQAAPHGGEGKAEDGDLDVVYGVEAVVFAHNTSIFSITEPELRGNFLR